MAPDFSFRPATERDIEFLWTLRQQTMKPYIQKSYGWNDDEEYEHAKENLMCARIIHMNTVDIGVVKIIEFPDHFLLKQIQILPNWCNKGIGSIIVRDLLQQAHQKMKVVRLHVLKINPAKNLYERLGFIVVEEFNHQAVMEYAVKAAT